jgi:hypothetical protein
LYIEHRRPTDPSTLEEVIARERPEDAEGAAMLVIAAMMADREVAGFIRGMLWSVADTAKARFELLTSDRPYVLTNGLSKPGAYLLLPIGPRKLFMATIEEAIATSIKGMDVNTLVNDVNAKIVGQAAKYVYSTRDSQLRYVRNRMGRMPTPSLTRMILAGRDQPSKQA